MAYAWLTPDALPEGGANCRPLFVPDSEGFHAAVEGALLLLADEERWEQEGTATPAECADAAYSMYQTFTKRKTCMPIGALLYMLVDDLPDYLLVCDGSQVPQTEYPELYALIGATYGSADSGYFRLPDLLDRVVYGGIFALLGGAVGSNSRAISIAQLPAHTHTVHTHEAALSVSPGELPVSVPSVVSGSTGSAGGGETVDIRQASLIGTPCIVAR